VNIQVNRPYIDKLSRELKQIAGENWDDLVVLSQLLVELLFRKRRMAVILRGQIVERIIEIQRERFPWPSTEVSIGSGRLDGTDWPKESLLSFMGYRTGQKGADEESRRAILDFIYTRNVPNVNSVEYMRKWDRQNTGKRLLQMARSLANFVKNEKRKDPFAYAVSIAEREADLAYLKKKYYIGRYDFTWPRTDV
jgi:hypothetical protein